MAEGASVKEGMLGSEDVGKGHITEALKVKVTELGFSQLGDRKPLMTLRQVSATVGLRFRSAKTAFVPATHAWVSDGHTPSCSISVLVN